ncbi:cysteine desulfurase family protein [Aureimonas sp. AU40]|uniref:cysteine desulfurase family protein n=1 Tax=Aureimonas sp. AU40 TaxID=1637747 RepID=UPI00078419DD|nr:aminotransferase class V-fold PLP-dependent enzyme [Aureimonas sp. AU40]
MTASGRRIYLDYNASAPLLPEAREAFVRALDLVGNPSSVHSEGRAARAALARARAQVAGLVGASADQVVFTSGASEAASTCLTPNWRSGGQITTLERLAVLDTDHPCIREGGRYPAAAITRLGVDRNGVVDFETLTTWAEAGPGLLAMSVANSETGALQRVEAISAICRDHGIRLVLDVVQMVGRLPIDSLLPLCDAIILSGHKIGASKGVGAFVLRDERFRPDPLITGGAQETRQRAGTEALPLVVAFGAAAEAAGLRLGRSGELREKRQRLVERLSRLDASLVLGQDHTTLPQTVALHHPRFRAETVQIALDLQGIAVSAGSACSSGKLGASHVLLALRNGGAAIEPETGAIRVSFGLETTASDLDAFADAFERIWMKSLEKEDPRAA